MTPIDLAPLPGSEAVRREIARRRACLREIHERRLAITSESLDRHAGELHALADAEEEHENVIAELEAQFPEALT